MNKLLFISLLWFAAFSSKAANIYSSASGGNWSDPATWVGGVLPAPADVVYIEAGATVVLDMNATVGTIRFNASFPAFGTLEINDPSTPRILVANNIIFSQNVPVSSGRINVSGAEHEIHVTGLTLFDNTVPSGTVLMDMPVGKLIFDSPNPSSYAQFGNGILKVKTIEIGNGVQAVTMSTFDNCVMYPNGRLIVKNNATLNTGNLGFGNEPTASLVIKNGGTYIRNAMINNNLINLNLGELEADIENGTYIQNTQLRRFLTNDVYYLPQGTFGNLYINETSEGGGGLPQYRACPKLLRVNGNGIRAVKVVGNFECKRLVSNPTAGANQTHGDVVFEGGANAADCANVTWEFAGVNKSITIGRDARIFFKGLFSGITPAQQPKVRISGTVSIANVVNVPEASTTAYKDSIEFYHLEVTSTGTFGFGPNAMAPAPSSPTPEHHRIKLLGNLTVDGIINLKNSVSNIIYFDNQAAATYSGDGLLTAHKICGRTNGSAANASKITSTLNEIFLEPNMAFRFNTTVNQGSTYLFAGNYTWFEAEGGALRIDNKDYSTAPINYDALDKMVVWNGIESTQRIALYNLIIEDSTRLQLNSTFNNSATNFFKINGDVTAVGTWSTIEHANSTNPTNVLEFGGNAVQNINAPDSTNFQLHRISINNPTKVIFNQSLKLNMGGGFGTAAQGPQLQLIQGVLQMGVNADKMVHVENIGTTFANGVSNAINDGVAPLNANDYSDSWVFGTIRMVVKQGSEGHNGSTGPNSFEYPVGSETHPQVFRISTNVFGDYWLNVKFISGTTTQPDPTICFVNSNSTGPYYGPMNELIDAGYWSVVPHVPLAAGHTPSVTLFARGYTNGNVTNPSFRYGLVKRTDNSSPWLGAGNDNTNAPQNTGTHLASEQMESNGVITCKRNLINSFSELAVAKSVFLAPLPMKWVSFEATKTNHGVNLTWVTAEEQQCKHYEVQKSSNGIDWEDIGMVAAENKTGTNKYCFFDDSKLIANTYYRIKQVDVDNKFAFSSIKMINHSSYESFSFYPNPSTMYLNLQLSENEPSVVEIYSLDGKLLIKKEFSKSDKLDVSGLSIGSYFIKFYNQYRTFTSQFSKI